MRVQECPPPAFHSPRQRAATSTGSSASAHASTGTSASLRLHRMLTPAHQLARCCVPGGWPPRQTVCQRVVLHAHRGTPS